MIGRLARILAAALHEWNAEQLLDALWLASTCGEPAAAAPAGSGAESGDSSAEVTTQAHAPDVENSYKVADLALPTGGLASSQSLKTSGGVTEVGLRITKTSPPPLTAATALSLFRRVYRPGRPVVDLDATVEATADAQRLVVVTRPERARGLDVSIVVDQTPVALVWADAITELEATLRRTGAFRTVSRWSLDRSAHIPSGHEPLIHDSAGTVHRAGHIIDPAGRRLVFLLSDTVGDDWRRAPTWQVLRRWAQAMPTVLVHLLPDSYWGYTAIGQPTAAIRSPRPAAPNSSVDVRAAWWSDEKEAQQGVPIPVIEFTPTAIVQWTRSVVTGSTWTDAIWTHVPQETEGVAVGSQLSAADQVRVFQARASGGAQRLAQILAGAPLLSLPLMQVLHEHLVHEPSTGQLAELMVSGLMENQPDKPGGGNLLLQFRPGVAELLYEGTTTSQEWDVFELLTQYLELNAAPGNAVLAVLADPSGTVAVQGDLVPFAAMGRRTAVRLGLGEPVGSTSDSHSARTGGRDVVGPPSQADLSTLPPIGAEFVGREQALAAISGWLADTSDFRSLIVTGSPGSGKTALLKLVAALSDPAIRPDIPVDQLPPYLPPMNAIAGMISVAGTDVIQVLAQLMAIIGVSKTGGGFSTDLDKLIATIGSRSTPTTVLLDALDESAMPESVVEELMTPLIRNTYKRLRLLMSTRPHLLQHFSSEFDTIVIDLDVDPYADPDALRLVVRRKLTNSPDGEAGWWSANPDELDRISYMLAQDATGSFAIASALADAIRLGGSSPDLNQPDLAPMLASLAGRLANSGHISSAQRVTEAIPDHFAKANVLTDPPEGYDGTAGSERQLAPVLWVDDYPTNNTSIVARLGSRGVTVDFALTTEDALSRLRSTNYGLIITDLARRENGSNNPNAGVDFIRQIQEQLTALPILVFTNARGVARRDELLQAGAVFVTDRSTEIIERTLALLTRQTKADGGTPPETDTAEPQHWSNDGKSHRWDEVTGDGGLVLGALATARTPQGYRTVKGLAQQTSLAERDIQAILDRYSEFVFHSRIPDRDGRELYRLRGLHR